MEPTNYPIDQKPTPALSCATPEDQIAALRRRVADLEGQLAAARRHPGGTSCAGGCVCSCTEGRFRESEATLRTLCDHAPVRLGVVELLDDDVRFLWVNEAFARHYRIRPEAVRGRLASALVPDPAILTPWLEVYWQASFSGLPASAEIYEPRWGTWSLATVASVEGNGSPGRFCFVVVDITERKRAEARLAEAQRIAHVGSWEWRVGTNEVWWSDEHYRILGWQPGQVNPSFSSFLELVHPDDREVVRRRLEATLSRDEPYSFEFRFLTPDGCDRTVWTDARLERDAEGRPHRLSGVCQDVTERRRAQEEKRLLERKLMDAQKLESLGLLAGGIAHDFNNLLTAILGNASLIDFRLPPDSTLRGDLAKVVQAAERAAELCHQMLAYSGRGRFVMGHLDLNLLVREMLELLQVSVSRKATLSLVLAEGLPAVSADATQIRQVVMNLLLNASEAVGDRAGEIRVATGVCRVDHASLEAWDAPQNLGEGEYVVLEVADTGCGMDEQTRARIFDPFFTTKFTGRGLGLAAVQGIVRGHRGAIQVESEPGLGTTFRVLLPAVDAGTGVVPHQPPAGVVRQCQGIVLVADDEPWVLDVATRMLTSLGLRVVQARDGEEALARFREASDDIRMVLLDLTMPRLDGEETFRTLHLMCPGLPVVLMSGYSEQEAASRFAGTGLAGFLPKPFRLEDLAGHVGAAMRAMRPPGRPRGRDPEGSQVRVAGRPSPADPGR